MLPNYHMNKKTFFLSTYIILTMCLVAISKERDFICDAFPSEKQVRYAYQKCLIEEMFFYDRTTRDYQLTRRGKLIYDNLKQWAIEYFKGRKLYFQPTISDLAIQYSLFIDEVKGIKDANTGMFILTYANKKNLARRDPLPEIFFPVDTEIEDDFSYKTGKEIFENKIGAFFTRSLRCEDQAQACDSLALDQKIVDRAMSGNPKDKAVLFVGFDQGEPAEGSTLYFDTSGYTRSLFWSLWGERPDEKYNAIKFCFCKVNEFLETNPKLLDFFDYIIIGAQTIEYVTADAWSCFSSMLKRGGRIVYPDISVDYFPPFLNMLLSDCSQKSKGFELYKCKEPSEAIYKEIKTLTAFNNEPTYGDVCYLHTKTFYWHKKL